MSLFTAISISASGMEAQRSRAEIITETWPTPTLPEPRRWPVQAQRLLLSPPVGWLLVQRCLLIAPGQNEGVTVSDVTIDDRDPSGATCPDTPMPDAQAASRFPG